MLKVQELSIVYGNRVIVQDISFQLNKNDWKMLVGPNGSGKSSVVGAISGKVNYDGLITYKGENINTMTSKEKARKIGILEQHQSPNYSFTVEEVVSLGRYPYRKSGLDPYTQEDKEKVQYALELTGLTALRNKSILNISGGELQRTFLAQLFAQDPNILILDEPVNHLDLQYQESIFGAIKNWVKVGDRSVLSIIHDLSIARYYGDSAILLYDKRALDQGSIQEVFTRENLKKAYNIDVSSLMEKRHNTWK